MKKCGSGGGLVNSIFQSAMSWSIDSMIAKKDGHNLFNGLSISRCDHLSVDWPTSHWHWVVSQSAQLPVILFFLLTKEATEWLTGWLDKRNGGQTDGRTDGATNLFVAIAPLILIVENVEKMNAVGGKNSLVFLRSMYGTHLHWLKTEMTSWN